MTISSKQNMETDYVKSRHFCDELGLSRPRPEAVRGGRLLTEEHAARICVCVYIYIYIYTDILLLLLLLLSYYIILHYIILHYIILYCIIVLLYIIMFMIYSYFFHNM